MSWPFALSSTVNTLRDEIADLKIIANKQQERIGELLVGTETQAATINVLRRASANRSWKCLRCGQFRSQAKEHRCILLKERIVPGRIVGREQAIFKTAFADELSEEGRR